MSASPTTGRVVATIDHLDFVHLNAGVVAGTDLFAISLDDYRRMFRVNVDGVAFGVRAVVPKMTSGAIVATASLAGIGPFADDPVYAADEARRRRPRSFAGGAAAAPRASPSTACARA